MTISRAAVQQGGDKDERNAGTTRRTCLATLGTSAVVSRIRRGRRSPPPQDTAAARLWCGRQEAHRRANRQRLAYSSVS